MPTDTWMNIFVTLKMGKTFGSTTSPTSPSTSSEFETLSPPPSNAENETSNLHFENLRFSVNSAHFDLLPDEIQTRLRDLLNENLELKETLHENNAAMSEQFGRLSQWQKEVEFAQSQNKVKFEESRDLIGKLREENQEMKKQLEIYKLKEFNHEKLNWLEKENEKLTVINMQLQEELKRNKERFENVKLSRNHLIAEKQELLATNSDLRTRLDTAEAAANLEMTTNSSNDEESLIIVEQNKGTEENPGIGALVMQLHSEQLKRNSLMVELMEERKEILCAGKRELKNSLMKAELNDLKQKTALLSPGFDPVSLTVASTLGQKGEQLLNTIKESEIKLAETNREYTGKKSVLEDRLSDCQQRLHSLNVKDELIIRDLKLEVEELRHILAHEQNVNKEDKMSLNAAHQQFENLLQDYQQLLHSWESYEHEQAKKGVQSIVYYDIQVKSLKEEIDRLTAQLLSDEETIAAKIEDNNLLRTQNRALNQEIEKIPILQAQLEIYQTDFRMEREANEKSGEAKDIAMRQVHQLEAKCHQLNEELEIYRRSRYRQTAGHVSEGPIEYSSRNVDYGSKSSMSRRLSSSGGAVQKTTLRHVQSASPVQPTKPTYYCPKCSMGFTDLQPLENHVDYFFNEPLDKKIEVSDWLTERDKKLNF
uniref:CCHC NOA-type domain-containing protein n=1 Tax=Strigamia maritima TaxID=126957 RepID=T1JEL1_STRMM